MYFFYFHFLKLDKAEFSHMEKQTGMESQAKSEKQKLREFAP